MAELHANKGLDGLNRPMEGVRHRLLKILDQHGFHTGTRIGAELGLSRAAIHKHIRSLVDKGVPIHRVPGRGYRLAEGVVLLDEYAIERRLTDCARALAARIEVLEEVDSTSAEVARSINRGPLHGRICLAEKQTAGRGRRGRGWVASPYRDLMLSIGVEYAQWPQQLPTLGLVTALSIIRALEGVGIHDLMVKWPNDVVCRDRKLCGVLLDVTGEAHGGCRIIVGIGINVSMDAAHGRCIDRPWVDLETLIGRMPDRNAIAAQCLNVLLPMFESFPASGFSPYLTQWRNLDALRGRTITVHSAGGDTVDGIAEGVDDSGRLLVTDEGGRIRVLNQGEVSIRLR